MLHSFWVMGNDSVRCRLWCRPGNISLEFYLANGRKASWSDSIRPKGFLSSVLLWLVIILAVVGVDVTVVVIVKSSFVVKLLQSPDGKLSSLCQNLAHSGDIRLPIPGASLGLVVLSVFAMLAAYASKAAETLSATSFLMAV
ncbi:hypothetical protein Tco_0603964 [Tanacetum coccineum]